jgi:hypothetical protein
MSHGTMPVVAIKKLMNIDVSLYYMVDPELSEALKGYLSGIVAFFITILFIFLPLAVLGKFSPNSWPAIFIVAGMAVFVIPGLLYGTRLGRLKLLEPYCFQCNQLMQDEDPKSKYRISLAKFQMLFWTIILGTSFTWLLLETRAAPEIPKEWLILMGISSGTYILAKVTKNKKEKCCKTEEDYGSHRDAQEEG